MRLQRLRLELGMELAAQEVRMAGDLDDLDVGAVRRCTADAQAAGGQHTLVLAVELVAMAMPFADFVLSIRCVRQSFRLQLQVHAPNRMVPPSSSTPRSSRSL